MTKDKKLDMGKAKEKMKRFSYLLDRPDVKCLYISPKDFPSSADFLSECWNNQNVSPKMFPQALKDGYFNKYLTENDNLDVFVLTDSVAKLLKKGEYIPVRVDQYPGLY